MNEIVSIFLLKREEIMREARQQAESGEPCQHGFEIGSAQACTWERAWNERKRELDQAEV